jgi:CDP-diacylglycerol--glycerol-3-phosphate 3-phosphatidyltransferase
MGVYAIKPRFQQALLGIERRLVARRVHPDYLTLGALALSLAGAGLLIGARWLPGLLLGVPFVAIVRLALNALDGMVARDLGVARPWGEVLNELCDRLSDTALLLGATLASGVWAPAGVAAVVLVLLSSYLGLAVKAAGGPRLYLGVMGKADRMIALAVASVAALAVPAAMTVFLVMVAAGALVTLVQRGRAGYGHLQPVR